MVLVQLGLGLETLQDIDVPDAGVCTRHILPVATNMSVDLRNSDNSAGDLVIFPAQAVKIWDCPSKIGTDEQNRNKNNVETGSGPKKTELN